MLDSFKHQGMRRKLIAELKLKGIKDERILAAFNTIPRHFFLDLAFIEYAYDDTAFRIGAGQTISQPYTVAFQTGLLDIKKGDKILEIGTGSGFQTCVLSELGAKVYSIERQRELFMNAKKIIHELNYNPRLSFGDGFVGLPAFAPFDSILITCGAPYIPQPLIDQLKVGGRLVIPLGEGDNQIMKRLTKTSETDYEMKDFGAFRFVPMLPDTER
jgi:protein-L-isoaspartate(D-aspartate) O-methyltransferase